VEKPLIAKDGNLFEQLSLLARRNGAICYTAYNHRFEPHFVRMREVIHSGQLGRIYLARLFYGNGTARDVRASPWRDQGGGVLPDLGSHLLDTIRFWFDDERTDFHIESAHRFENQSFDYIRFGAQGDPVVEAEATLLSWRNDLRVEVLGERGSAHIESLCKWGPSRFTLRTRRLPSGRPPEETLTLVQDDPTWQLEYTYFKHLCASGQTVDLRNDHWISHTLETLTREALERFPA